jgi:uncharacterized membrane protein
LKGWVGGVSYLLTPKRLAMSQFFIILYSALAAVLGRTWITFLLILALIVVLGVWQARRSQGPFGVKAKPEEVEDARELFQEESVRELQMKDEGLAKDIEAQSRALMALNLALLVGLAYFVVFWRFLDPLYLYFKENVVADDRAAHFLAFLVYLEGYFVISTVATYIASRRIGPLPMINMPSSYKVTEKGIVYKGLISKTALPFPLPSGVEVRLDESRRFVELVKRDKRSVVVLRLYSKNPRRLYQIIKRYGLREE